MSVDNQRLCIYFIGADTLVTLVILGVMMILRDGEAVQQILDIIKICLPVMVAALAGVQSVGKWFEAKSQQPTSPATPPQGVPPYPATPVQG